MENAINNMENRVPTLNGANDPEAVEAIEEQRRKNLAADEEKTKLKQEKAREKIWEKKETNEKDSEKTEDGLRKEN